MTADFGLSTKQLAWVVQSYSFCVVVGVLFGGYIADYVNPKHVFMGGAALFAIGSLQVVFAKEFDAVIVGRVLQGLGGGIFSPIVPLLLTRSEKTAPGRILMLWGSFLGLIAAVSPAVYSMVFRDYGWSLAFSFFGFLTLASILLVGRARPVQSPKTGFSPLLSIGRSKNLYLMFTYVFCTYGVISFYLFGLPLLAVQMDAELSEIGLLLSVFWLTFSAAGALLRRIVDTPKVKQVLFSAPFFIGLGCLVLFGAEGLVPLTLSAILVGIGFACSNAPSTQVILEHAPEQAGGLSASLDITFARLGTVVTIALLASATILESLVTIAVLCAAAAFAVAFLKSNPLQKQS